MQDSALRVSAALINVAGELLSGGFAGWCARWPVEVGAE